MSTRETLSRPYARAAFELALAAGAVADWSQKLAFASAVAADPQASALTSSPRIAPEQLATLFVPQGEAAHSTFALFIAQLTSNRRVSLLPEIAAQFEQLKRESEHVLRVRVTTAVALESAQASAIGAALKKRFDRDIEIDAKVDPSVLGGAVINAAGLVIDASVRGRLERLAQDLSH
ncbi:MAG TPA: F0F1 ATP synthase subunit delta [Pseudomonadota bacterium]|nr:F0F1 ATP synthase subunit delta [Rhodanobacteraceae bacterium]MBP9154187.1 F0F1 ATP synthase subunit delta [Xanthomonadales bacterium]HQW82204.1 F0F1 ATP synthase subunit delta [Pseudomonadota bacterium]